MIEQILSDINKMFSKDRRPKVRTKEDLESIQELVEALIDSLGDVEEEDDAE